MNGASPIGFCCNVCFQVFQLSEGLTTHKNNAHGNVDASNTTNARPRCLGNRRTRSRTSVPEKIWLHFRAAIDGKEIEAKYLVKTAHKLQIVKESFSVLLGLPRNSLRFTYDGHRIPDEATPTELYMDDDDIVDVFIRDSTMNGSHA